jgi:ribosomal protein L11 methyltransferase
MKWLEISVQADGEAAEAVCELFNRYGQGGAVVEESLPEDEVDLLSPHPLVQVKTFLPLQDGVEAQRQRLEEALWHLSQLYPIPPPQIQELAAEDWAEAWKRYHQIQRVGERMVIVPTWQEYSPHGREIVLWLDPGMAFGTGSHPTTRMCLVALEKVVRPGARVMDVGTGSGILAIAAARLGASEVLALDTDPLAVRIARENVDLNEAGGVITVNEGSPESWNLRPEAWDVIVINILADPIIKLARPLALCLAPQGTFIAGGILAPHEAAVTSTLEAVELCRVDRLQEKDWITLIGVKIRRAPDLCAASSSPPGG